MLASEAVSVSDAGAIEMKPEGKEAFMSWFFWGVCVSREGGFSLWSWVGVLTVETLIVGGGAWVVLFPSVRFGLHVCSGD